MEHSESLPLEQEVAKLIIQTPDHAGLIQHPLKEQWAGLVCDYYAVKPFITLPTGKEQTMDDTGRLAQNLNKWSNIVLGVFVLLLATGCHYDIRFEDIGYSTGSIQYDAGLVAVISTETVGRVVSIKSWATGIANTWDARPGAMLQQIAEVEFPQMFRYYRTAAQYDEPKEGIMHLIVDLSITHYAFHDFHATVAVQARVFEAGHTLLFEKSYREEGEGQGGKMVAAGAFGMKSAVRQSSFDAYKKVFTKLRGDLAAILRKPQS